MTARILSLLALLALPARAQAPDLIWESSPGGGPVRFSPDGRSLAAGSGITLEELDASAGQKIRSTTLRYGSGIASLAWSRDVIAVGSSAVNQNLRVLRASDLTILWSASAHSNGTKGVAFSPDGTRLASTGPDRTTKIWRVSDGALLGTLNDGVRQLAVAWSPDGTLIASGTTGGFHLWRVSDGALIRSLSSAAANTLAFSPDGSTLATGDALFKVSTGARLRGFPNPYPDSAAITVAFSKDGKTVIIGSEDFAYPTIDVGAIRFWDASTGALRHTFNQGTGEMVTSLSVSPDGSEFAFSFSDPRIGTSGISLAHMP